MSTTEWGPWVYFDGFRPTDGIMQWCTPQTPEGDPNHAYADTFPWHAVGPLLAYRMRADHAWYGAMALTDAVNATPTPDETPKAPLDVQIGGNHYKDMAIQPVEYIEANTLDYLQGNVVKYISRHKKKNGAADVRKALHYCQLILQLQYRETP